MMHHSRVIQSASESMLVCLQNTSYYYNLQLMFSKVHYASVKV